jgi:hypothetical protein
MAAVKKVAKKAAPKKPAAKAPASEVLAAELGPAAAVWDAVIAAVQAVVSCELDWRPAKKLPFGTYAVLHKKDRNLVYLLPQPGAVEVRVMLGERAFGLAMAARLPARIKKLAAEAKVYPEGHYIQIAPATAADLPGIVKLLECKLERFPKSGSRFSDRKRDHQKSAPKE